MSLHRRLRGLCWASYEVHPVPATGVRGDCIQDSDVNLCATSASRNDPLRDLLNSALSSPSSRCVITDDSGALIGTASDHDVIEAIRRAKEARTAA